MSLRETLKVITAGILLFASGYNLGSLFPYANYYRTIGNPLLHQQKETLDQLTDGAVALVNCRNFKRAWPVEYKKLMRILDKPIGIAYQPYMPIEDVIAYANIFGNQITVTPVFFTLTAKQRQISLAHEMLHLAGLPDHKHNLDRKTDAVYSQVRRCFPFDEEF